MLFKIDILVHGLKAKTSCCGTVQVDETGDEVAVCRDVKSPSSVSGWKAVQGISVSLFRSC